MTRWNPVDLLEIAETRRAIADAILILYLSLEAGESVRIGRHTKAIADAAGMSEELVGRVLHWFGEALNKEIARRSPGLRVEWTPTGFVVRREEGRS